MTKQSNTYALADTLGHILGQEHVLCAVAESCTGGLLAAAITDVPGSSAWFDRGFITYSNKAKEALLGVSPGLIAMHGAVSEAVVLAMAKGVISASDATVSVAISGIAGPTGGSVDKPVGTVWIAWATSSKPAHATCYLFKGDRSSIREQAVEAALEGLLQLF